VTIESFADLYNGNTNGYHIEGFRKNVTFVTTAGTWVDLSQTSGHPVINRFAATPLEASVLNFRNGIYHGDVPTSGSKILTSWNTLATTAVYTNTNLMLLDYVMYYPFIDGDSTELQEMENNFQTLPRYTDGEGLRAFVVAQGNYTGGGTFQVGYTNSQGVSGRLTPVLTSNSATLAGTIIHCNLATGAETASAFLPLQAGDTGIRSIDSFTWLTPNAGIFSVVICKVLAQNRIETFPYPQEKSFVRDTFNLVTVQGEAYLNFICLPAASLTGTSITGTLEFIWNE
jgi:hypothetical protein